MSAMPSPEPEAEISQPAGAQSRHPKIEDWLLLVVLAVGAYLRFSGINWDEGTHLHPDERFLTMVETSIQPPENLAEYFQTEVSPLNPHNAGHGFFVYGTLPIFLVRFLAEWLGKIGYDQVHILGRYASGAFDLISMIFLYLIGGRLYSRRVGLLASVFAALSVLLIQHSHFFVVDPFIVTFVVMGFYFAVRVIEHGRRMDYLLFGLALGMAVASKVSAAPLAGVVALAGLVRLRGMPEEERTQETRAVVIGVTLAALTSLLTFRILQPYAFAGTSFFDVRLNPKWLANLEELRNLSAGNADFPPAWQWAGRPPVFYSFKNLVVWGLGLPLGLAALAGWLWAAVRAIQGEWRRHLLPVVWVPAFFMWQAFGFSQMMRYQLPIYPFLALFASWGVWQAWEEACAIHNRLGKLARSSVAMVGLAVTASTALYAFGFLNIYTHPVTRVEASRWMYRHLPGVFNFVLDTPEGQEFEPIYMPVDFTLSGDESYVATYRSAVEGQVAGILLPHVSRPEGRADPVWLVVTISDDPEIQRVLARAEFEGPIPGRGDASIEAALDQRLNLKIGHTYYARLELASGSFISMHGSVIVSESSWDDGLPLRIDGRDGYGGYYTGVNQELYWPDNTDDDGNGVSDKLERIVQTLEEGDYLAISSNRQYGSIARITAKYPLTAAYYRALFGCPEKQSIPSCGARAEPGEVASELGYQLVAVFQSNPRLGPFEVNDQLAEEAFTVYDHPKVLIFQKTADFSARRVRQILGRVDVSKAVNILPNQAGARSPYQVSRASLDLMLPEERLIEQREGGTWSELFPRGSLINRSQVLAVVVWWLLVGAVGLAAFPWVRVAFGGLEDKGYPLARTAGLLIISWVSWLLGSFRVPVVSGTLWLAFIALLVASAALAWRDRRQLSEFVRRRWRTIARTEALALAFFLLLLLIRLGNPDLWHPGRGGEKPMDFSYLNAVIKSTSFPPYDPWFAGGYINYYYYGFVLVGAPVEMLGLIPSVAYNLILPTLYALLALGGLSVGYNLVARLASDAERAHRLKPWFAGLAAAVALVLLGNLGTVQMIYLGLKQIGATSGQEVAKFLPGFLQAIRGLLRYFTSGASLPYGLGEWYWNPSRAIPAGSGEPGPITEFPFFTFLYADLHAHMINLPLTLAALAWALSWLMASLDQNRRRILDLALSLFMGGLILGVLRPTNSWDFPAFWGLGAAAVAFGAWLRNGRNRVRAFLEAAIAGSILFGLALMLFQPFSHWFGQAYTAIKPWEGSRTPLAAYLIVHGVFLFVLISWMAWETRQWMAATPLSALNRLRPAGPYLLLACLLVGAAIFILALEGFSIALVVFPTMLWALILWLRPGMPLEKRVVLIMIAAAVALTFGVELVVLRGDIGRMNTVFKFYLQVWTLFSVSAGAALWWIFDQLDQWNEAFRRVWLICLGALIFGAGLYPILATPAKVKDRMAREAPHTLDGMAYMPYASYADQGQTFPLDEDYRAIRWMQENIQGSPVIVEANTVEYRWGSRFTIYTGLPGVLGWNWHQRQQRAALKDDRVMQRARDITEFYMTRSPEEAERFLDEYQVSYIVVGRLEHVYFDRLFPCWSAGESGETVDCDLSGRPVGMVVPQMAAWECSPLDPAEANSPLSCPTHALDKFERMADLGHLDEVYREGETVIYEVIR